MQLWTAVIEGENDCVPPPNVYDKCHGTDVHQEEMEAAEWPD